MIKFNNKNIRILKENGKVVILNAHNNSWVRMKETFYERNINEELNNNRLIEALNKYCILEDKVNNKANKKYFNTVYFSVTNKCNLNCEFCSMKSDPNESIEDNLSLSDIKNIVIPKLEKINPKRIILTGGEPTVRKDINDLIDAFFKAFGKDKIILQSNGLLLNENLVKDISNKVSKIDISIEKIFENQNFVKNMIENLDILNKNNVKVSFSFVTNNKNKKYLKDVVDLVVKYDADFCMRLVSPLGYALENKVDHLNDKEILLAYKDVIEHIIEKNYTSKGLLSLITTDLMPKKSCGGYGNVLSIYPNGNTFICPNLGVDTFKLGNIKKNTIEEIKDSLSDILDKSYVKNLFIVDNINICKDCSIKYFCTGFCPAVQYNCSDIEWISGACNIKRLSKNYTLFYYEDKKDNISNFKVFLESLNKYINDKEGKINVIN